MLLSCFSQQMIADLHGGGLDIALWSHWLWGLDTWFAGFWTWELVQNCTPGTILGSNKTDNIFTALLVLGRCCCLLINVPYHNWEIYLHHFIGWLLSFTETLPPGCVQEVNMCSRSKPPWDLKIKSHGDPSLSCSLHFKNHISPFSKIHKILPSGSSLWCHLLLTITILICLRTNAPLVSPSTHS